MKKQLHLIILFFVFASVSQAQQTTVQFNIKNSKGKEVEITRGDYVTPEVHFEKLRYYNVPIQNGKAVWSLLLMEPIFFTADFFDSIADDYRTYQFYLSPGDALKIDVDIDKKEKVCTVSGKGSEHNEDIIQDIFSNGIYVKLSDPKDFRKKFENDSLPFEFMNAVVKINTTQKKEWLGFKVKHELNPEFVRTMELYLQYYPVFTYMSFKGSHHFDIDFKVYQRNEKYWQNIEDSLIKAHPIDNSELLKISDFSYALTGYVVRTKERIWFNEELLTNYYSGTKEEVKVLFEQDPENLLCERIIQRHFTGKTAEFLFAELLHRAIRSKEDNLVEIYERFKQQFPKSENLAFLEKDITRIEEQNKRTLSDKMILHEDSAEFQTFDEVLQLMKGKTVLLDMWGTWCGPCRSEIAANSDSLKSYFKDQPLDFLYISSYDLKNVDKWKELIAYYNLMGTHILASEVLTKSIMENVKGEGFPTYVIIKRDGTFELSEAGYPMDRKVLINQLEKALK